MLRIILCLFITLVTAGCLGPYQDRCIYQRCGGRKPILAVLPVLVNENQLKDDHIGWDLSTELTEQIKSRFLQSASIYVLENIGNRQLAQELNIQDLEALSHLQVEKPGAAEFLVVTELVNHQTQPSKKTLSSGEEKCANLSLDFRIRVLDMRNQKPKVILQELVHYDHFIPRAYLYCDYKKSFWGTESYERTPLGMAHAQLAREVVTRVENYIHLAKG